MTYLKGEDILNIIEILVIEIIFLNFSVWVSLYEGNKTQKLYDNDPLKAKLVPSFIEYKLLTHIIWTPLSMDYFLKILDTKEVDKRVTIQVISSVATILILFC